MDDDPVTQALKKARYNEIVHVTIYEDAVNIFACGLVRRVRLIPCLNAEHGGIVFNDLVALVRSSSDDASKSDESIIAARELQTKQWFFPMLNDHARNERYATAIERTMRDASQNGVKDQKLIVLDIGTGTGLLSLLAARALDPPVPGAPAPSIVALEMSHAMSRIAAQTIRDNHCSHVISLLSEHSMELKQLPGSNRDTSPPAEADVCLSELLEHGVLGEGWLPTMRDAWDRRLLAPHCRVVPQRAHVYGRWVTGADWMASYRTPPTTPFPWPDTARRAISFPVHAAHLIQTGQWKFASDPVALFEFDVTQGGVHIPSPRGRHRVVSTPVVHESNGRDGVPPGTTTVLQGVLVWWDLELVDGLWYSTEPNKEPWQDHWRPCLHVLSRSVAVSEGDTVSLMVHHTDTCITIDVCEANDTSPDQLEDSKPAGKRHKEDPHQSALSSSNANPYSPERIAQLNDASRWSMFRDAIQFAHAKWHESSSDSKFVFLDVSDGAVGAWMAAQIGESSTSRILSLETSLTLPVLSTQLAAALLSSTNAPPARPPCEIEIVHCHMEELTSEVLLGQVSGDIRVDVVWAEPYYEILEGWHLQEALNFYYTVRQLRSKQLLSERTVVLPSKCRVMGCLIQSDQLHSAYRPCGENGRIRGMDHSYVNTLGNRFEEYDLSLPMWQYDYTVLSEDVELAVLGYNDADVQPIGETRAQGSIHTTGRCDALMVWLEYNFPKKTTDATNSKPNVLSTMNRSHRQAVRMLSEAARRDIALDELGRATFHCSSRFGSLLGPDNHQFEIRIDVGPD